MLNRIRDALSTAASESGRSSAGGAAPPFGGSGRIVRILGRYLVLLVALFGYSRSLPAPFYLDDHRVLRRNPEIRALPFDPASDRAGRPGDREWLRAAVSSRYVAMTSFALDYRLHGLDVRWFRATNVAIHLAAAWILLGFVARFLRLRAFDGSLLRGSEDAAGCAVALLFAAHPVQTQAVTYLVQRMASLAALFCLLAAWAFLRARVSTARLPATLFLATALTSMILALFTKQSSLTFPVLLIVLDLLFLPGSWRRRLMPILAVALVLLGMAVVMVAPGAGDATFGAQLDRSTRETGRLDRADYLLTQSRVLMTYLRLLVLPVGQRVDYDYRISTSLFEPEVLASGLVVLGLLSSSVLLAVGRVGRDPAWRAVGFGLLWFFVALAVESSVIPIRDVIFEHRLYLPSAGFLLALVLALLLAAGRARRRAVFIALAVAAVTLMMATRARNEIWRSEHRFWADEVAKSPRKPRVLFNMGFLLGREKRMEAAEAYFRRALAHDPKHVDALKQLAGLLRLRSGREEAAELYRRAAAVRPGDWKLLLDLRQVELELGDRVEAERLWGEAVRLAGSEPLVRQTLEAAGLGGASEAGAGFQGAGPESTHVD